MGGSSGEEMRPLVGLDSMLFIYLFEMNREHLEDTRRLFRGIESGAIRAVTSTLALTELLVRPLREGRKADVADYVLALSGFPNMVVKPLDSATAVRAAELRAAYGVRVPDALHLATAVVSGAEIFITNDRGLKRVKGIEVYDLKEALDYFHLGDKAT